MKIDLSETKPVYELHIWYDKTEPPLGEFDAWNKFDNKDEALEAYHKLDCAYKILIEYAGDDGDVLLEYSRGDERMIDTDKYEGHTPAPWTVYTEEGQDAIYDVYNRAVRDIDGKTIAIIECPYSKEDEQLSYNNKILIADSPLLLAEVKRLRRLCNTLFTYAHSIETGQSTIEKSNGEPLSTIDFEKDMTWVNWVNQPKISNIKIGGIRYLKITDDSIHSDGEADYVLATECKAGHLVGEIGYENCPDCGGEEE